MGEKKRLRKMKKKRDRAWDKYKERKRRHKVAKEARKMGLPIDVPIAPAPVVAPAAHHANTSDVPTQVASLVNAALAPAQALGLVGLQVIEHAQKAADRAFEQARRSVHVPQG